MMFIGVAMLLGLAIWNFGSLEQATRTAVDQTGPGFVFGPGYSADNRQFLTGGLAISFFFVWVFGGVGSPASMVRVMACKNTETIRRSIVMLAVYNLMIYLPLIMVCMYARVALPDLAISDEVIPRMALLTTRDLWGGSYLAGLILAAPFGAVMATVSSYLVVIASGLVRDVYQRFLRPDATDRQIKRLTYGVMMGVGLISLLANIRPVEFLQAIVVFCAASGAATFLVPAIMVAFWRRATAPGIMAAMLAGAGSMVILYLVGAMVPDPLVGPATDFRPYFLLNLEPVVWGMAASLAAGVLVSLVSRPPNESLLARLFDEPAPGTAYATGSP
jgi:SSS family solute:Na+ symporter/sodium/pantothenate symporter